MKISVALFLTFSVTLHLTIAVDIFAVEETPHEDETPENVVVLIDPEETVGDSPLPTVGKAVSISPDLFDALGEWQRNEDNEQKTCFFQYLENKNSLLLEEAQLYYQTTTGFGPVDNWKKLCPKDWPSFSKHHGMCICQHVVTHLDRPSEFKADQGEDIQEGKRKKKTDEKWWKEEWKAAHYNELKVSLFKEYDEKIFEHQTNRNQAEIAYRLACQDENLLPCGRCNSRLDQYAHYGSNMHVHVNGKGNLRGYQSKAFSGDSVKMVTTIQNGDVVGFEKGGVIAMSAKKRLDVTKMVKFITSLISIPSKESPEAIAKLSGEAIKFFFGIVKYTGQKGEGEKDHSLKVTFNSIGNAKDPSHSMVSNIDYTLKIQSSGKVMFEGKGKIAETMNSFYGSGFAAAITVTEISCDADVDYYPRPLGAWSYAQTYRSPYHGTNTLKNNIEDFIEQSLGVFGPGASSDEGYWEVPDIGLHWTDWLNRDRPSGKGDYELLKHFTGVCAKPVDIQCRTTGGTDWTQTNDVKVVCSPDTGLYCRNADQAGKYCEDYEVRFLCP